MWRQFYCSAGLRVVRVGRPLAPVLLWTDGAHEETALCPTTCGAVLLDQVNGVLECFGVAVPAEVRVVGAIPLLGSGKVDFAGVTRLAHEVPAAAA